MNGTVIPQPIWGNELTATPSRPLDWLWHGFIAGGATTLFTSRGKMGKTTLMSLLLSRRKTGGTLAGLAVKPGRTVVVSEEPRELWEGRGRHFGFDAEVCFILRPFLGIPQKSDWQALIDRILALRADHGIDLAILDPLGPFLRNENQARSIFDALLPLGALTRQGMAVTLAHHAGKGERPIGDAPRGSTALLGHVDISIEMRQPGGDPLTRRRRLAALSRCDETPRQLLIELNAEATDYLVVADEIVDDFLANWDQVRGVLAEAPQKLTRLDILDEWPDDFEKPGRATLWRWLDRAVAMQQVACEGKGTRSDPFRYWLPEREAVWRNQVPLYDLLEEDRVFLGRPFESLRAKRGKGGAHKDLSLDIRFPDSPNEHV